MPNQFLPTVPIGTDGRQLPAIGPQATSGVTKHTTRGLKDQMTDREEAAKAYGGHRLITDAEKEKMISTIHSMVYWVGILVPEYEMVGGQEIELRDLVYRLTTKENLSDDDITMIERLVGQLRMREKELERKLVHDPMTVDAAKALMEEIRGLLKAIDELRDAETEDHAEVGKSEIMARIEDAKRWRDFIETIKPKKQ